MKYKRQGEIIRIVREKQIKTHEQLIDELEKAGYDVTQATVSRDIKELGLIKAPSNSSAGAYYIMPSGISENTDKHINIFSDESLSMDFRLSYSSDGYFSMSSSAVSNTNFAILLVYELLLTLS